MKTIRRYDGITQVTLLMLIVLQEKGLNAPSILHKTCVFVILEWNQHRILWRGILNSEVNLQKQTNKHLSLQAHTMTITV